MRVIPNQKSQSSSKTPQQNTKKSNNKPKKQKMSESSSESEEFSLGGSSKKGRNNRNFELNESDASSLTLISHSQEERPRDADASKTKQFSHFLKIANTAIKAPKSSEIPLKILSKSLVFLENSKKIKNFLARMNSFKKSDKIQNKYVRKSLKKTTTSPITINARNSFQKIKSTRNSLEKTENTPIQVQNSLEKSKNTPKQPRSLEKKAPNLLQKDVVKPARIRRIGRKEPKDGQNRPIRKRQAFPKLPIQLKPSTTELSEFDPSKPNLSVKQEDVYLDGQLEPLTANLQEELSFNASPLLTDPPKQKRKRRTKKEMELFKILQKAINTKNEQEHPENQQLVLDKTEKTEEKTENRTKNEENPFSGLIPTGKKRRKRRTKKEMEELRAKLAQEKLRLERERLQEEEQNNDDTPTPQNKSRRSKSKDLDEEFYKNPKEEFKSMIDKRGSKRPRRKRKPKPEAPVLATDEIFNSFADKEDKDDKEKTTNNPEFGEFLTLAQQPAPTAEVEGVTKKIKRGPGRPRKDGTDPRPKKEKGPSSELKEKMRRRGRGRRFYYAPVFQKWERYEPGQQEDESGPYLKGFEGAPGIKLSSLYYTTNPYDFFSQFLPEFMFEEIARFTNISAVLAKERKENPQTKSWTECNSSEIKDLFALFFLFELIKKNNISEYWSDDPLLHISSVHKIMSEERFFLFKKFLSFYDKSKKTEYHQQPNLFYKCQFLVSHILEACMNVYIPEKAICLQEVLVNYEGLTKTNAWAQRKQRSKNEVNMAILKEANSGYIWNVLLNEGNKLFEKKQILGMLSGLEYKGYLLYMDSAFTSVNLLTELKSKHFAACGVSSERNLRPPPETRQEIRQLTQPGKAGFFKHKDLTVVVWNQNMKKVFAMANYPECSMVTIRKTRKIGYFTKIEYKLYEYQAPKLIHEMIENLKGNDFVNRGVTYYSLDYNSWKWYYRVMLYFLEMCMMNSYLLYAKVLKHKGMNPISNLEYRIEIIKKLCSWKEKLTIEADFDSAIGENDKIDNEDRPEMINELMFQDVITKNNCKLVYIGVGFCHYCRKKRFKLKKTLFWCKECQIGLCIRCFDQHKVDQILKRFKELDPSEIKNLVDNLIANKSLERVGSITNVTNELANKRFRKSKKDGEEPEENKEIKQTPLKPQIKLILKRKRAPYKKKKNVKAEVEAENKKKELEQALEEQERRKLIEKDLFEFSDDSMNERIKHKGKKPTPEVDIIKLDSFFPSQDNFQNEGRELIDKNEDNIEKARKEDEENIYLEEEDEFAELNQKDQINNEIDTKFPTD